MTAISDGHMAIIGRSIGRLEKGDFNPYLITGFQSLFNGDAADPANFHPITRQPVAYKIYVSVYASTLHDYLTRHTYIEIDLLGFCMGVQLYMACQNTLKCCHTFLNRQSARSDA